MKGAFFESFKMNKCFYSFKWTIKDFDFFAESSDKLSWVNLLEDYFNLKTLYCCK